MSVFSLRPRVRDLVFQIYGRPLHPELFDILSSRRFRKDNYEVTVWITRTGHVISWENADVHLTEVAAAVDQPLPQGRRLCAFRLRSEHTAQLKCAHGVSYQSSFQVETLAPEIFLHVHDEILADGGKRGLLHNFRPNHRLAVSPLGSIEIEAKPSCLFLASFHTFPEENTIIKSQSLIELK